jgi:hypothetical protein
MLCGLVLLLGFPFGAGAQEIPDPRTDAQVHLGPFYLTPRVAVKEFGVDGNVFNEQNARRDFTFTLAPHADVWVPFARRALVTTSVTTDLVYYQRYASERSVNPDVKVRGDLFLGRITPFAEGSYLLSRQRANYEIDARSRRNERGVRAGVNVRVSPKLSLELAADQLNIEYDADAMFNSVSLRETLNRESRVASVVVRHAVTPLTTLVMRAEGGNERFEFAPLRNSGTVRLMPGVEFKPVALISGAGFIGYRRFTPNSSSLRPFSGIVADATLSYTLLGSTRFTFNAERDVTYSYERFQPYFVVDGYGLTVRRQIVGRTDVSGGVHHFKYSYRDLLLPGAASTELGRIDVTRSWTASVGYRLGNSARVGVGIVYRERESNSERFRDYDGFRFISTVDYEL